MERQAVQFEAVLLMRLEVSGWHARLRIVSALISNNACCALVLGVAREKEKQVGGGASLFDVYVLGHGLVLSPSSNPWDFPTCYDSGRDQGTFSWLRS